MKKPGKVDKLEDSFFRTVRVEDPDLVRRFTNLLNRKRPRSKIPAGWLLLPSNQMKRLNSSVARCEIADSLGSLWT